MTWTATTLNIKDSSGAAQPVIAYTDGTNFSSPHPLLDNTGAIVPMALGHGTAATAIRVELPTDGTGVVGLAAGTQAIGSVTLPGSVHLTSSPTVTAGAYTTGQVVGGLVSLTSASRVNAGSGVVQSVMVTVKTALTAPFDVLFFDTNPSNSTFTDNAALAVNTLDLAYLCGVAHCTDLVSLGTPQLLQATGLAIPFKVSASNTTLYAVIVMRGGETLASTSAIQLSVIVLQD